MTTYAEHPRTCPTPQPIRSVAVVSRHPRHVFDTVLEAMDPDVVFVASIGTAYSRIKQAAPDLVVVCLSSYDADACQLLSMLALDSETSQIPVVTHFTQSVAEFLEDVDDDRDTDLERFTAFGSTN